VNAEITARLIRYEIQIMTEGTHFCVFFRNGCLAMVPRSEDQQSFREAGSSGLSTDDGLMYLVWRDGVAMLKGHAAERIAQPGEVEQIQQFSSDLKVALGLAPDPRASGRVIVSSSRRRKG